VSLPRLSARCYRAPARTAAVLNQRFVADAVRPVGDMTRPCVPVPVDAAGVVVVVPCCSQDAMHAITMMAPSKDNMYLFMVSDGCHRTFCRNRTYGSSPITQAGIAEAKAAKQANVTLITAINLPRFRMKLQLWLFIWIPQFGLLKLRFMSDDSIGQSLMWRLTLVSQRQKFVGRAARDVICSTTSFSLRPVP
jgi:hypothetical protein